MQKIISFLESGQVQASPQQTNRILNIMVERAPFEDEDAMRELYAGYDFYDDVNRMSPLDRDEVIKARILEMQFFKHMGVYRKVPRSEIKLREAS